MSQAREDAIVARATQLYREEQARQQQAQRAGWRRWVPFLRNARAHKL